MNKESEFGTVKSSLWNAFLTMLGAMLPEFDSTTNSSPEFARYLLVMFMMVMIILMLNILIALMGDTFATVRELGNAVWRMEQAAICIEEVFTQSSVWGKILTKGNRTCPHIHVLKYAADVETSNSNSELQDLVQESVYLVKKFTPLLEEKDQSVVA